MLNFDLLTCLDINCGGLKLRKGRCFFIQQRNLFCAFCLHSGPLLQEIGPSSQIQPDSARIEEDSGSAINVARFRIESQISRCLDTIEQKVQSGMSDFSISLCCHTSTRSAEPGSVVDAEVLPQNPLF